MIQGNPEKEKDVAHKKKSCLIIEKYGQVEYNITKLLY